MSTLALERTSSTVTTKDGTQIYFKDRGITMVGHSTPHGLTATHPDQVNAELLAFLKEGN